MNFEKQLEESYIQLNEAVTPMSLQQKKSVTKLKVAGWDIRDRDGDSVVMTKGTKKIVVGFDGKSTSITTEGQEQDVTALVDILEENFFGDLVRFLKRAFDNMTTIALTRGNSTYVIVMSRNKNEYAEIINGEVDLEGDLGTRREAMTFVNSLKEAGYVESSFHSVVPRQISRSFKFALRAAPTILIVFLVYSFFPGAAWLVNALARGSWSAITDALTPNQKLELESEMANIATSVVG